jgi:hypothetical protein
MLAHLLERDCTGVHLVRNDAEELERVSHRSLPENET